MPPTSAKALKHKREKIKQWKKNNPEKVKEQTRRWRARKRQKKIEEEFEDYDGPTVARPIPLRMPVVPPLIKPLTVLLTDYRRQPLPRPPLQSPPPLPPPRKPLTESEKEERRKTSRRKYINKIRNDPERNAAYKHKRKLERRKQRKAKKANATTGAKKATPQLCKTRCQLCILCKGFPARSWSSKFDFLFKTQIRFQADNDDHGLHITPAGGDDYADDSDMLSLDSDSSVESDHMAKLDALLGEPDLEPEADSYSGGVVQERLKTLRNHRTKGTEAKVQLWEEEFKMNALLAEVDNDLFVLNGQFKDIHKFYNQLKRQDKVEASRDDYTNTLLITSDLMSELETTLKMTAQVVETSVTSNSSFQNYSHPDNHTVRTTSVITG